VACLRSKNGPGNVNFLVGGGLGFFQRLERKGKGTTKPERQRKARSQGSQLSKIRGGRIPETQARQWAKKKKKANTALSHKQQKKSRKGPLSKKTSGRHMRFARDHRGKEPTTATEQEKDRARSPSLGEGARRGQVRGEALTRDH